MFSHWLCLFAVCVARVMCCQTQSDLVDAMVTAGLGCYNAPGMAVAVVKDGTVVHSRGYGVADIATQTLVDSETLFGISSNSKAFTTSLLAKLLDARSDMKISTNVYKVYREFDTVIKFNNSLRSIYATLEDLASHRMGISRNNYMRLDTDLTRGDLKRRVKYLKSYGGFRDSFYYSDLFYGLLADVTELLGGQTWEDLTRDHLFVPLNMTSSTFNTVVNNSTGNVATPYVRESGSFWRVPDAFIRQWGAIGGSGTIMSNADDMAKWLLFHLNGGRNQDGVQVVDEDALGDTYKPRNVLASSTVNKYFSRPTVPVTTSNDHYALGWKTGYYRGLPLVQHTGSSWGFRSIVSLIPSKNLGVFIAMSGSDPNYFFRNTLQDYIADVYMGETPWLNTSTICTFPAPWHTSSKRSVISKRSALLTPRRRRRSLNDAVKAASGSYHSESYGNMTLTYDSSSQSLTLVYGYGVWDLTTSDNVIFDGDWSRERPTINVDFTFLQSSGHVYGIKVPKFDKNYPPVFFRR